MHFALLLQWSPWCDLIKKLCQAKVKAMGAGLTLWKFKSRLQGKTNVLLWNGGSHWPICTLSTYEILSWELCPISSHNIGRLLCLCRCRSKSSSSSSLCLLCSPTQVKLSKIMRSIYNEQAAAPPGNCGCCKEKARKLCARQEKINN